MNMIIGNHIGEMKARKLTLKEKALKVYKYLLCGNRFKYGGTVIAMDHDGELVYVCSHHYPNNNSDNEYFIKSELPASVILNIAKEISDEELFVLGCERVLTSIHSGEEWYGEKNQ